MGRRHQSFRVVVRLAVEHISSMIPCSIRARHLDDGQHRNPTNNPVYFTDAFFHRPEELSQEFRSAGFRAPGLLAIEGPGGLARDFDRLGSNPKQRERLLDAVRKVESEQVVLRASSHIMAIARK